MGVLMISYRKGYKYQLAKSYWLLVDIVGITVDTEFIKLENNGRLSIKSGYSWDGPSGPTIDTKNFMRSSLVHDALYQLLRQKHLPKNYRKYADQLMFDLCREDGMSWFRAKYVYKAVRKAGFSSASPSNVKKIFTAP